METEILSLDKCSTRKIGLGSLTSATKLSWFNQTLFSVCILLVTVCSLNVVKGEKIENLQNIIRRSNTTKVSQNQSLSRNLLTLYGCGIDVREFKNGQRLSNGQHLTLKQIWNDAGSGSRDKVSIWRSSYAFILYKNMFWWSLGDIAVSGHSAPDTFYMMAETSVVKSGEKFKPADYFIRTWNDKGSGAYQDCTLWKPSCPQGYYSFGHVATDGSIPPKWSQACVHERFTYRMSVPRSSIWSDVGSGAIQDVTLMAAGISSGWDVTGGLFTACMGKEENCVELQPLLTWTKPRGRRCT